MSQRRVYTIPAHLPFVEALAHGILADTGGDPVALAKHHILLPTRRSCRSLREAFLRLGGGQPTLLPRMTPIGDVDEDELVLSEDQPGSPGSAVLDLPPAVPALRRQLILMRLIQGRDPKQSPDQAALLARELAGLMDQVATERLDFANISTLDVGSFADHWQETLEFLKLVTENWPAILDADGSIDPADRRNRLLQTQAERWRDAPPDTPVIAAGSTGSIPATADLLATISTLPTGAVVLPGLDTGLDQTAWDAVGPAHPQFGLKQLLNHLSLSRDDVAAWPTPDRVGDRAPESRLSLLRYALLPAPSTGTPVTREALSTEDLSDALSGVTRVDCPDPGKEAEVIAIAVRRTLETPEKTVALVTPDRSLARRVASELLRWGIEVDDSAGIPLDQTPPGTFLRLTIAMAVERLSPVSLLATLKHPMAAVGLSPAACRRKIRDLEIIALRGVRPEPGIAGLLNALEDGPEHSDFRTFLEHLGEIIAPLSKAMDEPAIPFAALLKIHIGICEKLTSCDQTQGVERLWRGEAGEALATFVAELHQSLDDSILVSGADYAALLDTLMIGRVVRPRHNRHPRVQIWGPMEARLQQADTLILGGLNEGTWPPEPDASPWMSRPMMTAFGLPLPERRIGLSAHDFAQAFSAPHIILTRADRVNGTPTVASRWLRRIENLVSTSPHADRFQSDSDTLALAYALDTPLKSEIVAPTPPAPTPPVAARPRMLPVTRIRTLQRDPYAIYARYILGLKVLDPIDADPSAADRGTIVHDALEVFMRAHLDSLPDDAEDRLIDVGRAAFGNHMTRPGVRAFWWPRFKRIAHWFITAERARRQDGATPAVVETEGIIEFDAPGGPFRLRARADRIDRLIAGGLAIIDYKTGMAATAPQAETGLEPQLPLEAAMAERGKFDGMDAGEVHALTYIRLSGGRVPGEIKTLSLDAHAVAENALEGLQQLVREYDQASKPYHSHLRPMKAREIGDYDHLARVREWLSEEEDI